MHQLQLVIIFRQSSGHPERQSRFEHIQIGFGIAEPRADDGGAAIADANIEHAFPFFGAAFVHPTDHGGEGNIVTGFEPQQAWIQLARDIGPGKVFHQVANGLDTQFGQLSGARFSHTLEEFHLHPGVFNKFSFIHDNQD